MHSPITAFRTALFVFFLTAALFDAGCGAPTATVAEAPHASPQVVVVSPAQYEQASLAVETKTSDAEGTVLLVPDSAGWLAYRIHIPAAGRYRFRVRLAATGDRPITMWLEDHYTNPDGRTYNLTSDLTLPANSGAGAFFPLSKDGCPLDSGTHLMKLHFSEGGAMIGQMEFERMKLHQPSPKTLTQHTDGTSWELVWSDEFEGEGLPDSSKWTYDFGNWGWGNNEPQYYTAGRAENARLENGTLIIEARKNDLSHPWTSARLTTRGKQSFLYGKIEFRAIVPAGDGAWAAGWLLGDAYRDEISWPYCGEIDVLECVGREIDEETGKGINHASCHTRAYYFKQGNHISETIAVEKMNSEFHTYAIEWLPTGIKAYVDDVHYYTYDKLNGDWEWPFSQAQNLIVNLAMGGGMGGAIDPNLQSQQLVLDYVRVFELR